MFKPDIKKMIDRKNELPPPPLLINKDKLIIDINNKLVEEKAGPESVILVDIKNPRRTWITYEYHLDIIYKVGDKQFTMLPNNYYDQSNYPVVFEDQLYERLARVQQSINRGI
jgi:hypothetical protein